MTKMVNDRFMTMEPYIRQYARRSFSDYHVDRREEAEQAVLVLALQMTHNLAGNGRLQEAYATPIARFAVRKYWEGRTGGVPSNSTDVMAEHCQHLGRSKIKHYGIAHNIADTFESEATALDARYPVHRTVQFRMDFFEGWFRQQTPKHQRIISLLATGESPSNVARICGLSPAYICYSQKRYKASWQEFIADKKESTVKKSA